MVYLQKSIETCCRMGQLADFRGHGRVHAIRSVQMVKGMTVGAWTIAKPPLMGIALPLAVKRSLAVAARRLVFPS